MLGRSECESMCACCMCFNIWDESILCYSYRYVSTIKFSSFSMYLKSTYIDLYTTLISILALYIRRLDDYKNINGYACTCSDVHYSLDAGN